MKKVQTKVDEGMAWLHKKMQEFGNTAKHQTPKTSPTEILAEKKVQNLFVFLLWPQGTYREQPGHSEVRGSPEGCYKGTITLKV